MHLQPALVLALNLLAPPVCFIQIVNDEGVSLPHDGEAFGRLLVRGPWVIQSYYKADKPAVDEEGWFDTGYVSSLSPHTHVLSVVRRGWLLVIVCAFALPPAILRLRTRCLLLQGCCIHR